MMWSSNRFLGLEQILDHWTPKYKRQKGWEQGAEGGGGVQLCVPKQRYAILEKHLTMPTPCLPDVKGSIKPAQR